MRSTFPPGWPYKIFQRRTRGPPCSINLSAPRTPTSPPSPPLFRLLSTFRPSSPKANLHYICFSVASV
ncbi:hypothetical protein JMJ77_0007125 [Colletotrichum scovillei]|uniref:Uncharacterized protein n=1 Tax=Colletotrichum scovillei TaxID=1209932 RepID=A0A9P7RC58_9PEZI|nr:hypothetical protein JMJ77_0007125 [Colletotrichum scovillei]KAG7074090.1 hypothetical protein JMJ76_0010578 [Colletotrichum scovillei]KAG7081432.1 hypothetical protein JMJ78_0003555 [Colletotrichum scovillei]